MSLLSAWSISLDSTFNIILHVQLIYVLNNFKPCFCKFSYFRAGSGFWIILIHKDPYCYEKEMPLNRSLLYNITSVADPDPYVLGPSGSGSSSQRYGSGSFYHQAIIIIKTLIPTVCDLFMPFYLWKLCARNVASKSNKQETKFLLLLSWRSLRKIAGSRAGSESVSQRYGSADPDP